MRRRDLVAGVAATAAAWPLAVHAQQKAMPVIGLLGVADGPGHPFMAPFYQGLAENGYVEGKNVAIEYRVADLQYERFPALAADLVRRKVDVIVTASTIQTLAAKNARRRSQSFSPSSATRSGPADLPVQQPTSSSW